MRRKIVRKNLFQKTVYEIYKNKETLGYKIIETSDMFVILWNNQTLSGLNVAHCEQFTCNEYDFLKREFRDIEVCIASNKQTDIHYPELKFDEVAHIMLFEANHLLREDNFFDVRLVDNKQKLEMFCNIAGDVFHMKDEIQALQKSLLPDLELDNCNKYIAYKNGIPVGITEICRGSEACLISWVGVKTEFRKQGICHAMLDHAINNEISKGCNKFVLVATEIGQQVYSRFGFETIMSRYDYILK